MDTTAIIDIYLDAYGETDADRRRILNADLRLALTSSASGDTDSALTAARTMHTSPSL